MLLRRSVGRFERGEAMAEKKYYWLKLTETFFEDDTVLYMESQTNGEKYSNFYLKLCLKSLRTNGRLIRLVGETLIPHDAASLARLTGCDIDTVRAAMQLFQSIGIVQISEIGEIYLPQVQEMVGSETDKAKMMRRLRAERANQLHSGDKVPQNIVPQNDVSQNNVPQNNVPGVLPNRYTEKRENSTETTDKKKNNKSPRGKSFVPPTEEEVKAYCKERNNTVNASHFMDYYCSNGWKVGRNEMKDWKAAVRMWERRSRNGLQNAGTEHGARPSEAEAEEYGTVL